MNSYNHSTGRLSGNGTSLDPPEYPDYSDAIASRISSLGFMKLREFGHDYRDYIARWGPWFGGFRGWLREKIDRQLDEEAAKSWEDSREWFV